MSFIRRDTIRWYDVPTLRLADMDSQGFSGGGGGGGATDLDGLTDVTITSAASGQVLKYNGSLFANATLGTSDLTDFSAAVNSAADARIAAAGVGDLSDVTVSTPSSGQVLKHDGSGFANSALSTSDISGFSTSVNPAADARIAAAGVGDLSDVTVSSPSSGQVLKHDGSGFANSALSSSDLSDFSAAANSAADARIAAAGVGDLSDVTVSSPSSGQVLKHDGSGFANSALSTSDISGFSTSVSSAVSTEVAATNIEDLANVPALGADGRVLTLTSGAPAWEEIPRFPYSGLSLRSSASQNINSSSTNNLIQWNTQAMSWGSDFLHRTNSDIHKITILTAGTYELSASVAFDAQSSGAARYNGIARFRLNNSTDFGPEGKGGYIRDATGHDESSVHIQTFPYTFAANDYIWLKIDRESSVSGRIDTTPNASALYIRRIN